jgi:hypothetical protein
LPGDQKIARVAQNVNYLAQNDQTVLPKLLYWFGMKGRVAATFHELGDPEGQAKVIIEFDQ